MKPRLFLRLVARLVPEARRGDWMREWEAELIHQERASEGARRAGARRLSSFRTIDALEDAVGMWKRNPGTSRGTQDIRLAFRSLARSPGFTLVALATLALGIGANTAIFSVVRSVVLRPLPYPGPHALVEVVLSFRGPTADRPIPASEPEFLEASAEETGLAELAGYWATSVNLGGGAEPVRVPVAYVSANLLPVLGVEPALGRGLAPGDDRPGGDDVVVLGHGLWTRAFGADPGVVGQEVVVNGRALPVVGVLPESFVFPGEAAEALLPMTVDPAAPAGRASHYISMLGRLEDGTTLAAAQRRLDDLAARWGREFPDRHGIAQGHPLTLVPLHEALVGDARATLWLLLGAAGLVLLVACANVASLLLLRSEHKQRERAVRAALGGTRLDVAAPMVAESLVLAAGGGALGLLLARASLGTVERLGPEVLQRVGGLELDGAVLLFTLAATVGATLLFGLGPALAASSSRALRRLSSERGGAGAGRLPVRRAIVVAEIALSVVLVVGSGLLVRSFARLRAVEPGFDADGVVTLEFSLSAGAYPEASDVAAFHDALAARLDGLPGVEAFGTVRALPFADPLGFETLTTTDQAADPENLWNASYQVVGPGYHEALGIPLLEGRHLERSDDLAAPRVVVVNQAMARAFWPGESPLGRRFKPGVPQSETPELTVVGVVGDVRHGGYAAQPGPQFFHPLAQAGGLYGGLGTRRQVLVVKSAAPAAEVLAAVREAIRALDPGLPVSRASTLAGILHGSVRAERFSTLLMGAFSTLALALGAVGIGGLVAYGVARRTRELGLRMALGARRGAILYGVLAGALRLTALGVALGVVASWWAAGLLSDQLFEVGTRDPLAFVTGPAALFGVALVAAWLPARRATRVDPVEAMRAG